jgi:hypothetical protein
LFCCIRNTSLSNKLALFIVIFQLTRPQSLDIIFPFHFSFFIVSLSVAKKITEKYIQCDSISSKKKRRNKRTILLNHNNLILEVENRYEKETQKIWNVDKKKQDLYSLNKSKKSRFFSPFTWFWIISFFTLWKFKHKKKQWKGRNTNQVVDVYWGKITRIKTFFIIWSWLSSTSFLFFGFLWVKKGREEDGMFLTFT